MPRNSPEGKSIEKEGRFAGIGCCGCQIHAFTGRACSEPVLAEDEEAISSLIDLSVNHVAQKSSPDLGSLAFLCERCQPGRANRSDLAPSGKPALLPVAGKPTVLVTSAEHYGAVLNADFDFTKYSKT